MKRIVILLSLCLSVFIAQDALAALASTEVMVQVKVEKANEKSAKKGTTQDITLDIMLNGKAHNPEDRTVKWTVFGKDQGTGEYVAIDKGDAKLDLSAGSMQKISTKKCSTTYSEKSTKAEKKNDYQSQRISYVDVPGEGVKYVGYGVQVFNGDKAVGEKFDPRSMEDVKVAEPVKAEPQKAEKQKVEKQKTEKKK